MNDSAIPAKRAVLEKRESSFGSASGRTRSYQEDAAVAPELRSRLESIGMRTRFNVSRGYGSPPPSHSNERFDAQKSTFATENQILQSVKNTRNAWNRTQSAPLYSNELVPFCGLRADLDILVQDEENQDPQYQQVEMDYSHGQSNSRQIAVGEDGGFSVGIGLSDLKRNRDEVFGDWADEEEQSNPSTSTASSASDAAMEVDPQSNKTIASLPKRSSPTNSYSPFRLDRANHMATTLPIASGLSSYLASAQDSDWATQDFSSFTGRSDF